MTDKPLEDEPGAQERFDRGITNALRTPPKPHVKKSETDSPKTAKATTGVRSRRRPPVSR